MADKSISTIQINPSQITSKLNNVPSKSNENLTLNFHLIFLLFASYLSIQYANFIEMIHKTLRPSFALS